ncbi:MULTISPECIES: hypothetical protein [Bacillota]|jgi:hypothetical protein|uniref:hypothetical protein n=1 Tax=Bacillota TaxID=1239 RepID=UPI0007407359|nr:MULTISPECIES: hypothetical protein [Bacillota]CUX36872.1 hypothetical protein BN3456_01772 [Clostridium sp. C105KSO13]
MSTDKDLESIKNGCGLGKSSTSTGNNQSTGITTEQRGQDAGVRRDIFTRQDSEKKGGK